MEALDKVLIALGTVLEYQTRWATVAFAADQASKIHSGRKAAEGCTARGEHRSLEEAVDNLLLKITISTVCQ